MPPPISEGNSESARLDVMNSKLDSLLKMVDEQNRAEIDMRQDITHLKKSVEAFKQQLEEVPVDKIAVKRKFLQICRYADIKVCKDYN